MGSDSRAFDGRGLARFGRMAAAFVAGLAAWVAPARGDLGAATLAIAGAHLTVSPESQTVPFRTPTIVETHLEGYDAGAGTLPPGVRVVGELVGPSLLEPLRLETLPGEPFRIPRLSLEGEHRLENIRLVDGEELLAFAHPRTAVLVVTQVLITRVTSRALTLDEIRAHGIVVDDRSMRAYTFNFGFGVEGDVRDYSVDILYFYHRELGRQSMPLVGGGSPRFRPPGLAPFILNLAPPADGSPPRCADPLGCLEEALPPIPGVIYFPTDLSLLNQFFSVVLMTTNGAPEGDPLVLRDLTARIRLPGGLRTARTEPPTVLGSPVPIRVPGPDGELGTADDLTFLVGQASGQAEYLVEGLREGTHVVEFDIEGILEGMPGGIRRIEGEARGAVVVRDPTLGIHVSHPDVVRADEEYDLLLTVSNTGLVPANLVKVSFPTAGLAGCEIVGERARTIPSLLPGESEVVTFRVRPLLTGRVISSYVRASSQVSPTFELRLGIGDAGIPLSPTTIVLPRETESLPPLVRRHALGVPSTCPRVLSEGCRRRKARRTAGAGRRATAQ